MELEEGERRAVEYLRKKFNPKSIDVHGVKFSGTETKWTIVVEGETEIDGRQRSFEVVLEDPGGRILAWRTS